MKTLYNLDPFPVVPNIHARAVKPGGSYDFTDEQVAAGITGNWSENDPRVPPRAARRQSTEPAPAGEGASE
jgi:hypothetical protein